MSYLRTLSAVAHLPAVVALIALAAHCHGQNVKTVFASVPRAKVEARLRSYDDDNSKRESSLHNLFVEAGCAGDALVEQTFAKKRPPNLSCTLPGTTDSVIVVGAHTDHVMSAGEGVVDDWSGAALLPSLFESLQTEPRRHTFIFVGFAEEERGLTGSTFYVSQLSKGQLTKIKAMVNLECLGLGPTNVWASYANPELLASLAHVANGFKIPLRGVNVEEVGSDDAIPFSKRKVPTISIHSVTSATFPILHSIRDDLRSMNLDEYYESYRLIAAYLSYIDSTLNLNEPQGARQSQ